MALFSITCTTCQSRLKVRDASAIGEILACPKCHSMVLVEPPPDWNGGDGNGAGGNPAASGAPPAASSAKQAPSSGDIHDTPSAAGDRKPASVPPPRKNVPLPRPAPSELAETVDHPIETVVAKGDSQKPRGEKKEKLRDAQQAPAGQPAQAKPSPPRRLALPDKTDSLEQQEVQKGHERPKGTPPKKNGASDKQKTAAKQDSPTPSIPASADVEEPVLPGDVWTSPTVRRWQQLALLIGGGVLGLVLAVGIFGYMISRTSGGAGAVADNTGNTKTASEAASNATTENATRQPTDKPGAPEGTSKPRTPDKSQDPSKPKGPGQPGSPPDADGTGPSTTPESSENDDKPVGPSPAPPGTAVTEDSGGSTKPAGSSIPNPFDGSTPPASSNGVPGEKPEDDKTASEKSADLAADLEKLSPFLLGDTPFLPTEPMEGPEEKDAEDEGLKPVTTSLPEPVEETMPRPEPRNVDLKKQLAEPVLQLEFDNVPLVDYLRFLSQMSNIPITVDPDAIAQAGITPSTAVRVRLSESSIQGALETVLAPRRLAFEASGGQLRIIPAPPVDGKPRTVPFSVDDLVEGDGARLSELAQLIAELIEPDSWNVPPQASAGGVLRVTAAERVWFQVLVFCEKLRVARGIPTRSHYSKSLFDLRSRREQAAARLSTPVTVNFGRPTPLVDILARLEQDTGTRILVDWQAVADAGWNPDGLATLTAVEQPLGEALTALLAPMDLAWRAADADTLQVTTPDRLASRLELEFYPVNDLLEGTTPEALLGKLREALGPDKFREGGGAGVLRFDALGKCLLASLPQPQQVALASQLRRWRTAE